jgi:hypothetical protein
VAEAFRGADVAAGEHEAASVYRTRGSAHRLGDRARRGNCARERIKRSVRRSILAGRRPSYQPCRKMKEG